LSYARHSSSQPPLANTTRRARSSCAYLPTCRGRPPCLPSPLSDPVPALLLFVETPPSLQTFSAELRFFLAIACFHSVLHRNRPLNIVIHSKSSSKIDNCFRHRGGARTGIVAQWHSDTVGHEVQKFPPFSGHLVCTRLQRILELSQSRMEHGRCIFPWLSMHVNSWRAAPLRKRETSSRATVGSEAIPGWSAGDSFPGFAMTSFLVARRSNLLPAKCGKLPLVTFVRFHAAMPITNRLCTGPVGRNTGA
jgi:hypothetical protein